MKNDLDLARHLTRIVQNLPFEVESWKLMTRSIWHNVYVLRDGDGRRFVLKLPNKATVEWEKKLRRERWVLKKLESTTRKLSPDLAYVDTSKKLVPFSYQMVEFLEGENIKKTQLLYLSWLLV